MSSTPLDLLTEGLKTVLREYGSGRAYGDASWLLNILADYSPQTPALNRVAALAAREGVPGWLESMAPGAADAVVTQAVTQLTSAHAIDERAAHDAVWAWARALDVGYQGAHPASLPVAGVDDRVARKIQRLLDDADDAESSGDYAEAVERYEEVLTLDPRHASASRLKAFAERRMDKARSRSPTPASSTTSAKEMGQASDPITAAKHLQPPTDQDASGRDGGRSFNTTAPNTGGVSPGTPSTPSVSVSSNLRSSETPPQLAPSASALSERERLAIRRVRQLCGTFRDGRVWTPWEAGFDAVKLTNALASYGQGELARRVVLLYDDTLLGGAREGFIVSTKGVYWKNADEPPQAIRLRDIRSVSFQNGGWVTAAKIFVNFRAIHVHMNDKQGIARHGSEIIRILAGLPEAAAQSDDLGDDGGLVIDLD